MQDISELHSTCAVGFFHWLVSDKKIFGKKKLRINSTYVRASFSPLNI